MQHEKLTSTHRKLTLLFTAIVFFVVCILGFSTLGAKYLNEYRLQKDDFEKNANQIQNILESGNIVLQTFFLNQFQERRKIEDTIFKKTSGHEGKPYLNFFILDENNEVVFENIIERIDFGDIHLPQDTYIHRNNGILYQMQNIKSPYGVKVVFYANMHYDVDDFLGDILILLSMISIFSAFFYFIGYRFVERALKPVEENIADMKDFIHNAGHELKTPLAVMRGNLQVMKAEGKLDENLLLQSIKEVDHMNGLIESLRELSEIGKLSKKEKLLLSGEIERTVQELENFAQEKHIQLKNMTSGGIYVDANKQELGVLLSNLIKNAIKYNTENGEVNISLSKNVLSIRDTGIGISKEHQEKIFERFYQANMIRSQDGFGIGLSLVKKIADANNWKIDIQSEVGKGTTFQIVF